MNTSQVKAIYHDTRRVSAYPEKRYLKMLKGFAHDRELTVSGVANKAIYSFFDRMPEDVKQRYVDIYNSLPKSESKKKSKNQY